MEWSRVPRIIRNYFASFIAPYFIKLVANDHLQINFHKEMLKQNSVQKLLSNPSGYGHEDTVEFTSLQVESWGRKGESERATTTTNHIRSAETTETRSILPLAICNFEIISARLEDGVQAASSWRGKWNVLIVKYRLKSRSSQETGFTQPRVQLVAHVRVCNFPS